MFSIGFIMFVLAFFLTEVRRYKRNTFLAIVGLTGLALMLASIAACSWRVMP